jgi:hypothetical protein
MTLSLITGLHSQKAPSLMLMDWPMRMSHITDKFFIQKTTRLTRDELSTVTHEVGYYACYVFWGQIPPSGIKWHLAES